MNPGRLSVFEVIILFGIFLAAVVFAAGCCGETAPEVEQPTERVPIQQCREDVEVTFHHCALSTDHGLCDWFDGERRNFISATCWRPDGKVCEATCQSL